MPADGSSEGFVLRKEHCHEPLFGATLKVEFIKQIRQAILSYPNKSPRNIYEDLSEV